MAQACRGSSLCSTGGTRSNQDVGGTVVALPTLQQLEQAMNDHIELRDELSIVSKKEQYHVDSK